jgi:hypothetical protein
MIDRRFTLLAMAAISPFVAFAEQQPTLTIGTTTVKLGMAKDALISALSAQYVVKQQFPNCKGDAPICHAYSLFETDNFPAGGLEFDRAGHLVRASVERLVGWGVHTDGDLSKAIVTAFSNFIAEGLSCSIGTSSSNSIDPKNPDRLIPEMIFREAVIECGNKRLRILSTKQQGHPDAAQLTEEIGCSIAMLGGCEK